MMPNENTSLLQCAIRLSVYLNKTIHNTLFHLLPTDTDRQVLMAESLWIKPSSKCSKCKCNQQVANASEYMRVPWHDTRMTLLFHLSIKSHSSLHVFPPCYSPTYLCLSLSLCLALLISSANNTFANMTESSFCGGQTERESET